MSQSRRRKLTDFSAVNVLVVEDEFIVSLTLKVQLQALGCNVVGTGAGCGDRGGEDRANWSRTWCSWTSVW